MPSINLLTQAYVTSSLSARAGYEYVILGYATNPEFVSIEVYDESGRQVTHGTLTQGLTDYSLGFGNDTYVFAANTTGTYEIRMVRNAQTGWSHIMDYEIVSLESPTQVFVPNVSASYSNAGLTGGDHYVGKVLEASVDISDANGYSDSSVTYTWYRMENDDSTEVGTGKEYTITEADIGAVMGFNVKFADNDGHPEFSPVWSYPNRIVKAANVDAVFTDGQLRPGSKHYIGTTLEASVSYTDPNGTENSTVTYNWYAYDGQTWVYRSSGDSYDVTTDDVGKSMWFTASFVDDDGYTETSSGYYHPGVYVENKYAPIFNSSTQVALDENLSPGSVVYLASASDQDSLSLSYTISGPDAGSFTIDSNSGQLTIDASPDYEAQGSYDLTVTVSDGEVADTIDLTLMVNDLNESPSLIFTGPVSVDENIPASSIVFTVTGTDPESDQLSYSISGPDSDNFVIDPTSGALRFSEPPDYESRDSYTITVAAFDGVLLDAVDLVININDLNEFAVRRIFDSDPTSNTLPEDAAAGDLTGITAFGEDQTVPRIP